MDSLFVGLRAQDFHDSLKNLSVFGPKEVYFKKTLLIGKAATLAMHLRGLLYIDEYTQLEYAAATLGISSLELPVILRELEEVDFISVVKSGETIRRVDIRVPAFRSGYSELGERWRIIQPSEVEVAGLNLLNQLYTGPYEEEIILNTLGINNIQRNIMLDVMRSGLLVATQTVDGLPLIYTPLAVDGNPTAYLEWAKRFPTEVAQAVQTLRNYQGLPISDPSISSNNALNDAIITGVLMPVEVNGATGDKRFIFAPKGGLSPEEKIILDKARAVVACVRYGQNFAAGRPIKYPHLIVKQLLDYKHFKYGHPDLLSQYGLLTEKLIGRLVDVGGGRWNFEVDDTDENLKALEVALDMLEIGETPSARIDLDAQKTLLGPYGYQCPATTRPTISRNIQSSTETRMEIIREMGKLIRGVSSNG